VEMESQKKIFSKIIMVFFILLVGIGCSPEMQLLNRIPINSVEVKVVDLEGNPIKGAQVSTTNGRENTTDEEGKVKVSLGAVGVFAITVVADNHMPSNFVVTMPVDKGKVYIRKLGEVPTFSHLNFGMMNLYPFLYNYMFSSFGYNVDMKPYNESDFTAWEIKSDSESEALTMKKGFLKRNDKGQEWWQMIIDLDDGSSYVSEVLFSADKSQILRYLEQIDGGEIQEKPVSGDWYNKPIELTEEARSGAKIERNVSVKTPAGTFTADLLKFDPTDGTALQIWESAKVPGGVVKYITTEDDKVATSSILTEYGSGAKSLLDSF